MKLTFRLKGGPGSGHFDHKGRIRHQGGSLPNNITDKAVKRGKIVGRMFDDNIHVRDYSLQTLDEYIKDSVKPKTPYTLGYSKDVAIEDHRAYVEQAIEDGLSIPPEVLEDYPDLISKVNKG
jgi:hypothetical protein